MNELEVIGFDSTDDPKIPNDLVAALIAESFGTELLASRKITGIRKIPLIIIFISHCLSSDVRKNLFEHLFCSPLRIYRRQNMPDLLFADHIEDYTGLALHLEGKKCADQLEHLYKVRAHAGNIQSNGVMEVGSFCVERPEHYDYLEGCGLSGYDSLMRAYILGTVAHEIAHHYRDNRTPGWDDAYRVIVRQEVAPGLRDRYVSDYVLIHERVHNTEPDRIENEDLVEAVRIYLTNPAYLQQFYPRRFEFLHEYMPFLDPGAIVRAVKSCP